MVAERVLLFGVDSPIGLSIIRELAQNDVQVIGIGQSKQAIGLYSRYLHEGFIFNRTRAELIPFVQDVCKQFDIKYLMTVSENDILFFNKHAHQLENIKLLFATQEKMELVIDKDLIYRKAKLVSINIPKSYEIKQIEELDTLAVDLKYPVILKWRNPPEIIPLLSQHNLSFEKAQYCYSKAELKKSLQRYSVVGQFPLIQLFCPGSGVGQMIFMHNSEPLLKFQHKRIHEYPPEGGFSTVCESLPVTDNSELMEKSIKLLKSIGWEGPAMVEYRFDPDSGESVLMEINGRFWGSLPLAYHSGATFAFHSFSVLGKNEIPKPSQYKSDVRSVYLLPELRRLLTILFFPQRIQNKNLKFNKIKELFTFIGFLINPNTRFFVFVWKDPKPFFADIYLSICNKLGI